MICNFRLDYLLIIIIFKRQYGLRVFCKIIGLWLKEQIKILREMELAHEQILVAGAQQNYHLAPTTSDFLTFINKCRPILVQGLQRDF